MRGQEEGNDSIGCGMFEFEHGISRLKLSQKGVIIRVRAYPIPNYRVFVDNPNRPLVHADTS